MSTKKPTLLHAMIPIIWLIGTLASNMIFGWGLDVHLFILMAAVVAGAVAMSLGYSWKVLEEGIVDTIKMSMGAILILMVIGMVIGTWIISGVVPTMIYYGLQILSPGFFLVASTILCAIVSLSTGSSWTTAGTVGIALMGIGAGMGMAPGLVAGSIISGAYFGDKMSPLSDTTNLAPAIAGADLFDHIKHMLFTTGPSLLIALVIYGIMGISFANSTMDSSNITLLTETMKANFNLSPFLLLAPVLVIFMVVKKIPALPGLIGGSAIGGIFAVIFQGTSIVDVLGAAHYGFESATGVGFVDDLLSRGGLDGMMWTVSLILIAMSFGGIMERAGLLHVLAKSILKFATNTGNLVVATIFTIIVMNLIAGDQYLAIVIPGRMYKDSFEEMGLAPKNLSRVLEDAGTLTSPLVPWNSCGLFMSSTLGVATVAYLPFAFLNLINPLVSIFYGYTGITMEKIETAEA